MRNDSAEIRSSSLFCRRPLWAALAWTGTSTLWCCPSSISSANHGVPKLQEAFVARRIVGYLIKPLWGISFLLCWNNRSGFCCRLSGRNLLVFSSLAAFCTHMNKIKVLQNVMSGFPCHFQYWTTNDSSKSSEGYKNPSLIFSPSTYRLIWFHNWKWKKQKGLKLTFRCQGVLVVLYDRQKINEWVHEWMN